MSRRFLAYGLYFLFAAALAAAAGWYGLREALDRLEERAAADLTSASSRLAGQLEAFREQAVLIADHPEVTRLLATGDAAANPESTDRLLQVSADRIGAREMAVLNSRGQVLASSAADEGRRLAVSLAPHFRRAMQGAAGFHHAVLSGGDRVFLFAAPVFSAAGPVTGAVVVQVDASRIEAPWRGEVQSVFFSDRRGIVFVSNRTELLFSRRFAPQPGAADFGYAAEQILPFVTHSGAELGGHDIWWSLDGGPYLPVRALHLAQDLPVIDMTAEILLDAAPALRLAALQAAVVMAFLSAFGVVFYALSERRRALAAQLAVEEEAKQLLESRVAERTQELSDAVEQLRNEVVERLEAEEALRKAQRELVQAGKLSALGQMSAGISHELNQPLMAIRSFAENGSQFIARGKPEVAAENLNRISDLARRMGRIIKNLRAFARQEVEAISDVDLVGVVDVVLEMTEGRIARCGTRLEWARPEQPVMVRGGEVRLQQVVMNLVSNALDAMEGVPDGRLVVTLGHDSGQVILRVADNGPGIADPERIFDPFYSTKEVGAAEGMGLGLSISYGIINSFGGAIVGRNVAAGGAEFIVTLLAAEESKAA